MLEQFYYEGSDLMRPRMKSRIVWKEMMSHQEYLLCFEPVFLNFPFTHR